MLVTGEKPTYLRREPHHPFGEDSLVADYPLWWPSGKIAGKYLTPYLAARAGVGLPRPPESTAIAVEASV